MRPSRMTSRALGWHEWLVKRIGSVLLEASIAVLCDTSTIMMRCWPSARRRASATLMASPRISPIFSRGGMGSAAKQPKPSMRLRATRTSNFW